VDAQITVARADDVEELLRLLDGIAAWLQSIGMRYQWPASFTANEAWVKSYRGWVDAGMVFLTRRAGEIVGTFRLTETDAWAWPEGDDEGVFYLHTLGVRRDASKSGLGGEMLRWAGDEARRRGKRQLRLDCDTENGRLKRYYRDAGFEERGEQEIRSVPGLYVSRGYVVMRFAKVLD
jgi:ribosomal protein S18 acetylase RimI-like enzyme